MSALETLLVGECYLHGWHGRTVCPRCYHGGHVALPVRSKNSGNFRLAHVSASLLRFRGGGREKCRLEARCRMCLRPRGPETTREWKLVQSHFGNVFVGSRPLSRHHLLPLSWFKGQPAVTRAVRSVDANIVPLCRVCHDEVELDEESRRMLRRVLGAEEVSFVTQLATEEWFASRYPR